MTDPVSKEAPAGDQVFRRMRIAPAYKAVSAEIERIILSGALEPGAPLPTEQELAQQFGVNRSTLREAIRQVEQEGLVERREGRRLFVALPGLTDFAPRAMRALVLQQATFHELWQVAVVLEPLAAQLAASAAREDDLQALAANLARMDMLAQQAATENAEAEAQRQSALIELDVQFHALVARAGRNRALMLAREPVSLLYSATLSRMQGQLPQMHARNLAAHRHIVEALRQHDAERAEHWMRKHIVDFQRGFVLAQLDMHVPVSMAE
ncbi:FadR/GntR family transcriptional regulator [Noviherbaspirillum soli]|uniref:FadR/GntR family transcriptional regulator n=1 Tax=Noviherbaspirillum soli TaxID=1064518 RepID=UPI001E552632|nr:GntR family transcriptional regulator [Noviherbaspirillum soli]